MISVTSGTRISSIDFSAEAFLLFFLVPVSQNLISKNGWIHTGRKIFKSCSGWSAGIPSRDLWNSSLYRVPASLRPHDLRGRARSVDLQLATICLFSNQHGSSTPYGPSHPVAPRRLSLPRKSMLSIQGL